MTAPRGPKPAAAGTACPQLNRDRLAALREFGDPDDSDCLREFITLFLADAPQRLEGLRLAQAAKDSEALRREAHGLKGSSRSLGAERLAEVCSRVEEIAPAGACAETEALVRQIEAELAAVTLLLRQEIEPTR